jgi:hypothetical protein
MSVCLIRNEQAHQFVPRILVRVRLVVLHKLQSMKEDGHDDRGQEWANPIDPMVTWKGSGNDLRSESTSWINSSSGKVHP